MRALAGGGSAVLVYRGGKWLDGLSSEEVLPGDLIALSRAPPSIYGGQVETVCPADVVLLQGSVTVNESALTGESTPLQKEPLDALGLEPSSLLDMQRHRSSILLGGTKLLQHSTTATGSATATQRIPPPKGGGAVGLVLRTGFRSSQGDLIRTILFASERVTENNVEACRRPHSSLPPTAADRTATDHHHGRPHRGQSRRSRSAQLLATD